MPVRVSITALYLLLNLITVVHPCGSHAIHGDNSAIAVTGASPNGLNYGMPWPDTVAAGTESRAGVAGLFSPGAFVHRIIVQPPGNHLFVSSDPNSLTQFQLATDKGSIGLLAHNDLAGAHFLQLEKGDPLFLFYADGTLDAYRITEIADFEALSLYSYRDLRSGQRYSDVKLFEKIYTGNGSKLVLQTCLARGDALAWGRRFVIALRVATSPAFNMEYWMPRGMPNPSYRFH